MGVAPELWIESGHSTGLCTVTLVFQTITSLAVPVGIVAGTLGTVANFQQWNDVIGKTLYAFAGGSIASAQLSKSLAPGQTFGIGLSFSQTGTVYMAFNAGGNVGWFSMNLGGPFGAITYLEGAYGSMGEGVHVGTVPAPGALALGAVGIRRKRAA